MTTDDDADLGEDTALAPTAATLVPRIAIPLADIKLRLDELKRFVADYMVAGTDYGEIPGTNGRPVLLKPGAEKLKDVYALTDTYVYDAVTEDYETGLFAYRLRCLLHLRQRPDVLVTTGVGEANSFEMKYRYRFIATDKKPSKEEAEVLKARGVGRWRKGDGGWVWLERVENPNLADTANTILKMAKKRALVDAMLSATRSSELFTQDLEDTPAETHEAEPEPASLPIAPPRSKAAAPSPPPPASRGRKATPPPSTNRNLIPPPPDDSALCSPSHGPDLWYVTKAEVVKRGQTDGKPWTLYNVTFSDGRAGSTLSDDMYELAKRAAGDQSPVDRTLTPNPRNPQYFRLEGLTVLEPGSRG